MGVIPIVNENDTLAVAVSFIEDSKSSHTDKYLGNQIRRQRHIIRHHFRHGQGRLPVSNDRR